jgi:uncharacterized protein (DUF1501 family)
MVASFINSGLDTMVYYVSQSGYDTHVGQAPVQSRLLKEFSEGVSVFISDLKSSGTLDNTLILVFSEFGRRVEQNASNGTDHGTANNIFLFGTKLRKKGIINELPDLSDLDQGDLKYKIDFRDVYATILSKWLETDSAKILNGNFPGMDFF